MTTVTLDALDLSALLCSRVCHDVISPVGAIVNGLEVLEDEAWEAPDSLSDTEWRAQSGWDGRCDPAPYDEEDGR